VTSSLRRGSGVLARFDDGFGKVFFAKISHAPWKTYLTPPAGFRTSLL
jgi:hypothetical protein